MWRKVTKEWKPSAGDFVRTEDYDGSVAFWLIGDINEYQVAGGLNKEGKRPYEDTGCGCCAGREGDITHVWPNGAIGDLLAIMKDGFPEEPEEK
jgi:hypothetical protein